MLETTITLPSKPRAVSEADTTGMYEIDGLYPGYGHTLGNSLRRIILSSLPGAAITQVKIEGVQHEFSTLPGVKEDILTLLLNLKRVRLAMHSDEPLLMTLKAARIGAVTAADIAAPSQIEVLNPEQYLAELTAKGAALDMELTVERGLGYVPREVHQKEKIDIGSIALDAVFTPIRRVNYEVENMRVGDRTDYNRLRLFIETDGSLTPRQALERSIEVMVHQLKAIIGFREEPTEAERVSEEQDIPVASAAPGEPRAADGKAATDILKTRVETLTLGSRTAKVLEDAGIRTLGGLVRKRGEDLLAIEGIGPKALGEIETVLTAFGLSLKE